MSDANHDPSPISFVLYKDWQSSEFEGWGVGVRHLQAVLEKEWGEVIHRIFWEGVQQFYYALRQYRHQIYIQIFSQGQRCLVQNLPLFILLVLLFHIVVLLLNLPYYLLLLVHLSSNSCLPVKLALDPWLNNSPLWFFITFDLLDERLKDGSRLRTNFNVMAWNFVLLEEIFNYKFPTFSIIQIPVSLQQTCYFAMTQMGSWHLLLRKLLNAIDNFLIRHLQNYQFGWSQSLLKYLLGILIRFLPLGSRRQSSKKLLSILIFPWISIKDVASVETVILG